MQTVFAQLVSPLPVTHVDHATGATRRALQATAIDATLEVAIVGFAGQDRPVLLGITERLDFVDALAHAAGPVSLTMADGEVEIFEPVRQGCSEGIQRQN